MHDFGLDALDDEDRSERTESSMPGRGGAGGGRCRRLGAALRWMRLTRGLSEEEVAARAGVRRRALRAVESGRRPATLEELETLLAALGADFVGLGLVLEMLARSEGDLKRRILEALLLDEGEALVAELRRRGAIPESPDGRG